MSKETLKQTAEKLFASTNHTVLFGVASVNEFFTSENLARLACKKGEEPVKFSKEPESGTTSEKSKEDVKKEHPDNAKNTIAKIKETTSLEALAEFETDIEDRVSVLAEIEKQKAKLIAELPVQTETVSSDASQEQTGNGNEETEESKEQSKNE